MVLEGQTAKMEQYVTPILDVNLHCRGNYRTPSLPHSQSVSVHGLKVTA
jgi:hypothetical protein